MDEIPDETSHTPSKNAEKKLDRKHKRRQHNLERQADVKCTSTATKFLAVCNAGLSNGLSEDQITQHFSMYGDLEQVCGIPEKTYYFVEFKEISNAVTAYENINGKLQLAQGNKPLYLSYIEAIPTIYKKLKINAKLPKGLLIFNDFIDENEEKQLLGQYKFENEQGGSLKNRQVRHFGYEFRYDINNVKKDEPMLEKIPTDLNYIFERLKCQENINLSPDQLTINYYKPGNGIPSHIDTHSAFEDFLVCLSVGSGIIMEFGKDKINIPVFLPNRSLLIMSGESRYIYSHKITPRKLDCVPTENGVIILPRKTRISFTFRKVLQGECKCNFPLYCDSQNLNLKFNKNKDSSEDQNFKLQSQNENISKHENFEVKSLSENISKEENCKLKSKNEGNSKNNSKNEAMSNNLATTTNTLAITYENINTNFLENLKMYKNVSISEDNIEKNENIRENLLSNESLDLNSIAENLEKTHVHTVYNKIAEHFSETRHKPWPNVNEFLQNFPIGSILLDVGCGNGKYLNCNKNLFNLGCDMSFGLLEVCTQRNLNVFSCNCLQIPILDNSIDCVICIAVIHHLSTENRRLNAIKEMVRVLKVKGRVLIYVWAKDQCRNEKSTYIKQDRKNRKNNVDVSVDSCENVEFCGVQLPVHVNRKQFVEQDMLVPWKNKSETDKSTFLRYYHVFEENELETLCSKIENVNIVKGYYDQGNWCVILEKIS